MAVDGPHDRTDHGPAHGPDDGYPAGADADPTDPAERLAAARHRSEELHRNLVELAGSIAETAERVAEVHDHVAAGNSERAPEAARRARAAREFAASERDVADKG